MIELNKIYCENCLETMAKMPDKCCDIFTDPPYNVGKEYGVWDDSQPEDQYLKFLELTLNECIRVSNMFTLYIPKKWNLWIWNLLGNDFQEIMLPFRPSGAIRRGFSNQFNKLLTNSKPIGKPILNVWDNMPTPGMGYFFREETFGHPGYTSQAITERVIVQLCQSDVIYDPFMGTGTTAAACIIHGKNYIGSEISQEYVDLANKRLIPYLTQTKLELA